MTGTTHDTGYKLLFSHPQMVRDLLTGYMPGAWLSQADFSTLERVNASITIPRSIAFSMS